ncbi:MAG: hypothetical protein M3266_06615, partial [Actinomycetota bacterium]|nr:hypothetical protein [Actinomycetota bacterium]
EAYSRVAFAGAVLNRDQSCNDPLLSLANLRISRRQLLKVMGGVCAYGMLASFPRKAALAQGTTDLATRSDSVRGPAMASEEQAWRWLSADDAARAVRVG